MKILMVLEHYYPEDERVTKEIRTLQQNGHEVSLACINKAGKAEYENQEGIEIFRKPISAFRAKTSVGALKFPFYFNYWTHFISTVFDKKHFNAIHIHDLPLAKVGYKLSKKYNTRFVLDLHENWPVLLDLSPHTKSLPGRLLSSQNQWLSYENKYASLADGLIVVAEEMKNRLLKKGVVNHNIAVVPNTSITTDFEKYRQFEPDKNHLTLYYAGGITSHRGLDVAIRGISQMDLKENFRFQIIGSGRHEQYLKNLVKELHIEDKVHFMGWNTPDMVMELLFKSDIAVIPHLKNEHTDNTSPNKIFHYMLAKKPVLSSNCNYLENIIKETDAGLVYSHNDSSDFAVKLTRLISDRQLRMQLGENGYQWATEKYNWEHTSKSLIELYNTLN